MMVKRSWPQRLWARSAPSIRVLLSALPAIIVLMISCARCFSLLLYSFTFLFS
ncbi:hypothetical protein BDV34DRAFT_207445 [Aspergillus parasiticus]|uniref:Uncharacterized protein n=1 Tax=Aspergillus parasiticus TaxID=5067 RepID=A0A5N6D1Q7_ASPPA|nr:hypothetical protein BDV34DRAFT_207445 [Aspergillus parasiticus]